MMIEIVFVFGVQTQDQHTNSCLLIHYIASLWSFHSVDIQEQRLLLVVHFFLNFYTFDDDTHTAQSFEREMLWWLRQEPNTDKISFHLLREDDIVWICKFHRHYTQESKSEGY